MIKTILRTVSTLLARTFAQANFIVDFVVDGTIYGTDAANTIPFSQTVHVDALDGFPVMVELSPTRLSTRMISAATVVPEPSTDGLFAGALAQTIGFAQRRRSRTSFLSPTGPAAADRRLAHGWPPFDPPPHPALIP